ncbi:MAG TPA: cyclic nucleotide-binding domain-containing protein [Spirochaetota bacterium]|nr:cyclic nucleotide-binding domain-containing protein [Spirochaetota bacterium]HPU87392.1 cyclic nucleotide-binding domain-containing protein [Spirochaetota bacterium]
MDTIRDILRSVPLFGGCSAVELDSLRRMARAASFERGRRVDVGAANSLFVVAGGTFEIESAGPGDPVFLAPGSFFGDLPLARAPRKGAVRARTDGTLIILQSDDLTRLLLSSFKAFRAYADALAYLDIAHAGAEGADAVARCRVITVFGPGEGSGKSFFAACLGAALPSGERAVILDASYRGVSVFSVLGCKMMPAISQRQSAEVIDEKFIFDRVVRATDSLSAINIVAGSKVRIDPSILPPILYLLAREYRYVIIDLSDYDEDLRAAALAASDIVFCLLQKEKDRRRVYDMLAAELAEGQRLFYVLNAHNAGQNARIDGGLLFEAVDMPDDGVSLTAHAQRLREGPMKEFVAAVTARRRGLVLEPGLLESVAHAGALAALREAGRTFDVIYAASMSFAVAGLYLLSSDNDSFRDAVLRLFSEERLNALLDISFPEEFVFRNTKLVRWAAERAGDQRMEFFGALPAVRLADEQRRERMCTAGYLRDALAASLLLYPVAEPLAIGGTRYHAGYPDCMARGADLRRAGIDEVLLVSIASRSRWDFSDGRLLSFYGTYLNALHGRRSESDRADAIITIDIDEKRYKPAKIISDAEKAVAGALAKSHNPS